MIVLAFLFVWRYPLPRHSDTLVDIGKLADYGVAEFAGYVGGIAALFLLYLLALKESRHSPHGALPVVLAVGSVLAAVMAWLYPVNAIDLFIYAVRSRLFTTYGENPLAARPVDFANDRFLTFASPEWADNVSPYGPLWNLIAAPVTLLAGDNLLHALLGFKLLALASLLVGAWLIARVVATINPGSEATAALLYLWNPLVLWEGIGNGHNDVVMVMPLLLAVWAWVTRRDSLVIPSLVVAALIKYVAVLVIPLAAVALWRRGGSAARRFRLAVRGGLLSILVTLIAFAPFYDVAAVQASIRAQGGIFLTSPAAMAVGLLRDSYAVADIRRLAMLTGQSILTVGLLLLGYAVWRRPDRLPRVLFEALFLFLMVATWNFRAWYLIWLVALAALLPWGWPAIRTIVWSAGGLSMYAIFIWIWEWWEVDFYTIQNLAVPIMTGPALLLTLIEIGLWLTRRREQLPEPSASRHAPRSGAYRPSLRRAADESASQDTVKP